MSVRIYNKWRQGPGAAMGDDDTEYNASNAQVYEDGTLGPRPGWRLLSTSNSSKVHDGATDSNHGVVWFRQTDDEEGLLVVFRDGSTTKYDTLSLENNTWYAGGTIDDHSFGSELHDNAYDDANAFPCWNDGFLLTALGPYLGIATNTNAGTFTVPASMPDGQPRMVTIYRERAYYYGFASAPGRVYYSVAANYANWDDGTEAGSSSWAGATSFFDVNIDSGEYAGAVTGMWSVKNALLISRKDDRWLVLTGTSPVNGTLRELGRDQAAEIERLQAENERLRTLVENMWEALDE